MEKQPIFKIGDRVIRINEGLAATILEVIVPDIDTDEYMYYILYDEGQTEGNDGKGYWLESSLQLE